MEAGALETGQRVVLAFRPERAEIAGPGEGTLSGTLSNIVYFGTDTTYHVAVPDYRNLQVRSQNRGGAGER